MIRLGLRLVLASGREAAVRLAITALAVALGAGLLLATVAGVNAVDAQNERQAWLNTGTAPAARSGTDQESSVWWLLRDDYFRGEAIGRVDIAGAGPDSPVPPGIDRLPGPGEFYASPALADLLRSAPAGQLGDRFPGRQVGTIGAAGLPSPDSLLVVVGRTPEDMSRLAGAKRVTAIASADPSQCPDCYVGIAAAGLKLVLAVVAAGLLFPVLVFVGTATRLTAARREQRFAAMRLVGATPRQVSVLSAVEAAVAAAAGTALGFALFYAVRPVLAEIPFTGARFFPGDMSLTAVNVLLVALGIPAGAAAAARLALHRVRISPLGVSRRVTPRPPRARRLIPLAVGVAELAYFVGRRPQSTDGQIAAYLSGIFMIMFGLLIAGPWLTALASRALAGRGGRPAALIAARRLADNPQAGFRAVSGLMLALFVTSVATGVMTTIMANRGAAQPGSLEANTLSVTFWLDERVDGQPAPSTEDIPAGLRSAPGVRDVLVVRAKPGWDPADGQEPGLIPCADLARTPAYGACPAGAEAAAVPTGLAGFGGYAENPAEWPAAAIAADEVRRLPVLSIVVATDGSTAAIERARTLLATAFPDRRFPATGGDFEADFARTLVQWQRLANVVILASLPVAGCSLAAAVAGGLIDRKRPFALLRLTGVRLGVLRRVVLLESAVPLLTVAALAVGAGLLAAHLFLTSQMGYRLEAPGPAYYLTVAAGLVASLGIIASTLPLLSRITGPETARNE